jgi:tellurite resistance protein TerC
MIVVAIAGLIAAVVALLLVDLLLFARGRDPGFREAAIWSVGWVVVSLLAALVVLRLDDAHAAINYTTVYLIERSLSLDNLLVFLLLFRYFGVLPRDRARLLFWGIVAALALRALAILGGVTLLERFHFLVYVLGVLLLLLAWRVLRGVEESVQPERNLFVRIARRLFPVSIDTRGGRLLVREQGRRYATPLFLCMVGVVFADITFAIDSIPAAFAITREPLIIWMGNAFALLGLRALFVLVEWLVKRFRYLNESIALVLALVALKLMLEGVYQVGPVTSFAVVLGAFVVGIVASLAVDRRQRAYSRPTS